MPKIVDHEQRRREIVDAYLSVLAKQGIAGTNGRSVAAELGVVPGTLWHYFHSFEDIGEDAALHGIQRTLARIERRAGGLRGLPALLAIGEEILPTTEVTREEARVVVAFWGQVHSGGDARSAFGRVREFTELTTSALQQAVDDGELIAQTPVGALVRLIDSVYAGEQVISAADSSENDPDTVRRVLATCVAPWLADADSPASLTLRTWLGEV
ncbi:TetR/AcrR family transcriptional regulator [Rathayibacter sp. YIM 133350]|uniref:TetR/AcrR family transcriptional regulator n=1 Tax=Rathayibacter sp. YIM 133350 TaxID=3131992 RepID=UPI00307FCAF6